MDQSSMWPCANLSFIVSLFRNSGNKTKHIDPILTPILQNID